jgi:hypothetical protein
METFEKIENMIADLTLGDQLELLLEITEKMMDQEQDDARNAYEKDNGFYMQDLKIAEKNYSILSNIWNQIQEIEVYNKNR